MKKTYPEVKVGQVWQDKDSRMGGYSGARHERVTKVEDGVHSSYQLRQGTFSSPCQYATLEHVVGNRLDGWHATGGKPTRVRVDLLQRRWELVGDVEDAS